MTELFLDGNKILIKESISIKLIDENPYITQSGKYTYDIEIPLAGYLQNTKVFKHMHRMDVGKEILQKDARLIIDGHNVITGTATITSITDSSVKIQILSGNANLNFLSKNENLYIDELDLGDMTDNEGNPMCGGKEVISFFGKIKNENERLKKLFGQYGETDFVFFPVGNKQNGVVLNNLCLKKMTQATETPFWKSASYSSTMTIGDLDYNVAGHACAQPYFCTVLKRIFETLGYKLVENQIENTILKNVFIVNSQTGGSYTQLLPHWTLNEFIEQVEYFFGVVLKIDDQTKEIRILLRNSYWKGKVVFLNQIEDEYTVNCDEEQTTDISNGNISYNLEDVDKYLKINEDVLEQIEAKTFNTYSELSAYYNGLSDEDKKKYIFEAGGVQYIHRDGNLTEVNQLRDLVRNTIDTDVDIELKIIPVDLQTYRTNWEGCAYDDFFKNWHPTKGEDFNIVIMQASEYILSNSDIQGSVQELIEGTTESPSKNTFIEVAMNDGVLQRVKNDSETAFQVYPWPFILTNDLLNGTNNRGFSFELNKVDGRTTMYDAVYNATTKINTQCENVIQYISNKMYDPMSLFIIRNKPYICKQIEYKVNSKGVDPQRTGYFYEVL